MITKTNQRANSKIGETHGRLTITGTTRLEEGRYKMVCKCKCGKQKEVWYRCLKSGTTTSCGCFHKEIVSKSAKSIKHPKKDGDAKSRIGETHNRLTITGIEKRGRNYWMLCQCQCGNTTSARYPFIKSGNTTSCGCAQREAASVTGSVVGLNNSTKRTVRFGWQFNGKRMRSGFEVMFAQALQQKGISFEYEPKCFKLRNGSRYTPDFFVAIENRFYEIKGVMNLGQQLKIEALRQQGIDIQVLYQSEVEEALGVKYTHFKKEWCKTNGLSN
jgi:hypothetical protein